MKNLLYIIASLFFILWIIGFIIYAVNGFIHIFLVIAVILVVLKMAQDRKNAKDKM